MTKEQALNYLKSSGFSKEQIQAIVKALSSSDNLSSALEKNSEKLEKDFVESDCISRAEVNQVIEDYMDEQYHVLSDRTRERAFGAKAVRARINELPSATPQEPRWIPVSEKYPKPEDEYKLFLVTDDEGVVSVQTFYMSIEKEPQPYFSGMVNVIAWMPLPKAYSEVEK